jgi:hypothetical protein
MPPANPTDEPIDIVARPVNPDGTVGRPETESPAGPDSREVSLPGGRDDGGAERAEVRYWRFEGAGDDGCGCGGCGCLTAVVMLLGLLLLRGCAGLLFR